MIENFSHCLKQILKHEGGYVNHPKDPGGETNLGVTRRVWEGWVGRELNEDEMKTLTIDDVTPMYKKYYWDATKSDQLPSGADLCVFDFAVNGGVRRCGIVLQKTVRALPVDGIIGSGTVAAVNKFVEENSVEKFIEEFLKERIEFYKGLKTFDTFGKGWLARVEGVRDEALNMV